MVAPQRARNTFELYRERARAGECLDHYHRHLADHLVQVPTAGGLQREGSSRFAADVLKLNVGGYETLPIFTSPERFLNWCAASNHPKEQKLSLDGADLCLAVGSGQRVADIGSDHYIWVDPAKVLEIAVRELDEHRDQPARQVSVQQPAPVADFPTPLPVQPAGISAAAPVEKPIKRRVLLLEEPVVPPDPNKEETNWYSSRPKPSRTVEHLLAATVPQQDDFQSAPSGTQERSAATADLTGRPAEPAPEPSGGFKKLVTGLLRKR